MTGALTRGLRGRCRNGLRQVGLLGPVWLGVQKWYALLARLLRCHTCAGRGFPARLARQDRVVELASLCVCGWLLLLPLQECCCRCYSWWNVMQVGTTLDDFFGWDAKSPRRARLAVFWLLLSRLMLLPRVLPCQVVLRVRGRAVAARCVLQRSGMSQLNRKFNVMYTISN